MKKYIYLIVLALILGLVLAGCSLLSNISQVPATDQSGITYLTKHTEGDPLTQDLIAGGGNPSSAIDVGDVLVWNDEDFLYVKYIITESDWCLTETHLHVATSLAGIPQKNGNPTPGKFDYKGEHDCLIEYTYEIPLDWNPCTPLYIVAHAVVEKLCLPDMVEMELTWPSGSPPDYSYFLTFIDLTTLNDSFGGWCADAYTNISLNTTYANTYIYSSLDGANPPDCILVRPWGSLNWILNHWQDNPSNSWQDAQVAIWTLIHEGCDPGGYPCACLFVDGDLPFAEANVEELLEMACSNSDFVPESDELVAVILLVGDICPGLANAKQMTFIGIPRDELYCQSETAWGEGLDFDGKNWATYFTYTIQCPPPILINGGFEDPTVDGEWGVFLSVPGWTIENYDPPNAEYDPQLEIQKNVSGWAPYSGVQYAELDSYDPTCISQEIETCPCADYTITFWYSPRPGVANNHLIVYWDGEVLLDTGVVSGSGLTQTSWTEYTQDVQTASELTSLKFCEVGPDDQLGMFIDDISIEFKTQ